MSEWGDVKTEPLTGRLVWGWKGELQARGEKEGHSVSTTCTSLNIQEFDLPFISLGALHKDRRAWPFIGTTTH